MILRLALALIVATVIAVLPGCWPAGTQGGTQAGPPVAKAPLVEVGQPIQATVTDYEEFPGRTVGLQFVEVRPRVSGLLVKQLFKDGDDVDTDEPLFQIDREPFEAEVARAEATLEQAKAHRQRLAYDYARAVENYRKSAISREEFDKFKGDLDEGKASVGIAEAVLKTAQLNLKWTDVTAFPEDPTARSLSSPEDPSKPKGKPRTMRASRRMVDPGNMVTANQTALTTLINLEKLYVEFDIDEPTVLRLRQEIKAGRLKSRDQAPVQILTSPANDDSYAIETQIDFSDNTLIATSGTLTVRGTITNEKIEGTRVYLLSPGMQMKVRVRIGEPHPAFLVADQAINNDLERKFIYVVGDLRDAKGALVFKTDKDGNPTSTPKKTAIARYVKLGKTHDGLRAIEPEDASWTLDEGTTLVVRGMQRVRRGQEVAISRDHVPMSEIGKPVRAAVAVYPNPAQGSPASPNPAPPQGGPSPPNSAPAQGVPSTPSSPGAQGVSSSSSSAER